MNSKYHSALKSRLQRGVLRSRGAILSFDFDRVIAGHGDVIERDGKAKLHAAIKAAEFPPV